MKHDVKGFTLVEMVVVLSIVAILATLAVPPFIKTLKYYERETKLSMLVTMLNSSRLHSLLERRYVVVCPTTDGHVCSKANASEIMSFVDDNQNKYRDVKEIVLMSESIDLQYGLIYFNVGFGRPYIRYFPDTGKPRGYMSNITYCPKDGDATFAKSVIMNNHGRARYSFDKNGDGTHDNGRGKNLSC